MKDVSKRVMTALLSVALACAVPLPALADEGAGEAARAADAAAIADADRESAVQELITNSLKAGAATEGLSKATNGAVSIDFENLPQAPADEGWIADADAYLTDLAARTPQLLAEDEEQAELLDAQGSAVSYAVKMANWSVGKGRSTDLSSEAVYMYMSHYIDIGSNYWSAGGLDYLVDGPARSNTQPFLAQWLLSDDRTAYSTYLKTTGGTKQLAKIGSIAIGAAGVGDTISDVRKAASTLGQLSEAGYRSKASVAGLSAVYGGAMVTSDIADLMSSANADMSEDPTMKVSALAEEYLSDGTVLPGYDEMARQEMVGIVLGMAASALLAGAPVAAIGAGAIGLVASAASISLYMASDIYSRVAWAAMRYGWSGRYSMRLYEQLFG